MNYKRSICMLLFTSKARYSNGQSVNSIINHLQDKYKFLDKFDTYASNRLLELIDINNMNNKLLNKYLTMIFKEYLLNNIHGIKTKDNGISFIDTSLMINTTKVRYIE